MTDVFRIIKNVSLDKYNYKQITPTQSIESMKEYVLEDSHAMAFSTDGMIKFFVDMTKLTEGPHDLYVHQERLDNYSKQTPTPQIPKRIHFIWFSKGRSFNLVNYLAIMSAMHHHPEFKITLHCDEKPECNIYFDQLINMPSANRLQIEYFQDPEYINGNYVQYYQNRADYIRLKILKQYGGIYLDTDILLLRKLDCFLNNQMVVGYERPDTQEYICNAVLMSVPNHPLIEEWLYMYEKSWGAKFIGWYIGHSLIMGSELTQKYRHLINIVPHDTFYPFTWKDHSIIEDEDNGKTYNNSFSVHLWDTEFQKTRLLPETIEYFKIKKNALTRLFGHYLTDTFWLPSVPPVIEEEFMMLENMDIVGYDLEYQGGKSIEELKALCRANPKCVAFNSVGFLKHTVMMDKLCYLSERGFDNCRATDSLYIYKPRFR